MQEVNDSNDHGKQMGVEALSLSELADRLDVSKGYISRRAREGKDVKGHDVAAWAVRDGTGRLDHFRVPESAFTEQADDAPDDARENTATDAKEGTETATAKARVQSIRDVARAGRERRENAQAQRDKEQLEADRQRRERAEKRRNARAEERDNPGDPDAHTYTVSEMAKILDATAADVRNAVADGRDVQAFPVNDFAVTDENGDLQRFRVPHSAFEDTTATESSRETADPGTTQPKSAPQRRSGIGGLLALGAATVASAAMGAFDSE